MCLFRLLVPPPPLGDAIVGVLVTTSLMQQRFEHQAVGHERWQRQRLQLHQDAEGAQPLGVWRRLCASAKRWCRNLGIVLSRQHCASVGLELRVPLLVAAAPCLRAREPRKLADDCQLLPHSRYCTKTLSGHTDWVRRVVSSNDGSLLASCSSDQVTPLPLFGCWCRFVHLTCHSHESPRDLSLALPMCLPDCDGVECGQWGTGSLPSRPRACR